MQFHWQRQALPQRFYIVTLPTASHTHSHPEYRPDIDGLRALAILPVVIYHAFPNYMRSGFAGVDVFFVISGYLISTIILRSLAAGRLDFLDFYIRRAKRLFPSLLLVLGSAYVFAWFALFPKEYQQFGKHLAAGAGYVENFVLLQESGYFDLQSQLKPLMHLWSLSVEEQFYLVYPIFLWLAWKFLKSRVAWAILGLAVCLFAWNVVQIHTSTDAAYFSPQTRFWELLLGGLLACSAVFKPAWISRVSLAFPAALKWSTNCTSIVGFVLIFLSMFAFTRNELYPGWWALIPVMGAFLLILSGPAALINRTLLSRRILVGLGLISYPLYLWHWPLLSFGRILVNETPPPAIQLMLVFASFALALGTYRFLEIPFRQWSAGIRMKMAVLCVPLVLLIAAGLLTYGNALPWQVPSHLLVVKLEEAKKDWKFPPEGFAALPTERIYALTHGPDAAEKTLLLGDSNMEQYASRIEKVLAESPQDAAGVILVPIQKNCDILNAVLLEQGCVTQLDELAKLVGDARITRVVLVVAWIKYEELLAAPENQQKLSRFLGTLSEDRALFIFRNIPADPENLSPDAQISRGLSWAGGTMALHPRVSTTARYNERFQEIDAYLTKIADATQATLVSPVDHLCPVGTCPAVDAQDNFLYIDAGHMTASYARNAAAFMDPLLLRGRSPAR